MVRRLHDRDAADLGTDPAGAAGCLLEKLNVPLAPIILGMILWPLLRAFKRRRAKKMSENNA